MTPNDDLITRSEYESRHGEIHAEITRIMTRLDLLDGKVDHLSNELSNSRVSGWRLLSISLINFIVGGGLASAIFYFVHLPK
jgi:hypothetical protein